MASPHAHLSKDAFARLVQRAIASVPPDYADLLKTIAVVVEEEPSQQVCQEMELDPEEDLLGLYQGLPVGEESFFGPGGQAPAQIVLYRGPIVRCCTSDEEIMQEVRDTLVHELGHHVGLDDDEMPYCQDAEKGCQLIGSGILDLLLVIAQDQHEDSQQHHRS